ncbi:hypothetical protein BJF83_17965 [Nocardiopsis sp. CNR-923]|uniref:hypothetical protein n=1 Tax=Nocardiopsis sp. CNR-923 TaxID=1904965 RepID=UPI00095DBF03|nr:hypothetical protein [Nocardiopsis sp. CNR-923]OLT27640.1 hypothetical protein BJF83_17965 [Nocardiopsis sp. CNR-923]
MRRPATALAGLAAATVLTLAAAAPAEAATGRLILVTDEANIVLHLHDGDADRCVDLPENTRAVYNGTDGFVLLNSAECAFSAQLGLSSTLPPARDSGWNDPSP